MNLSGIVGLLVAILGVGLGAALLGEFTVYFDLISLVFVLLPMLLMPMVIHGHADLRKYGFGALWRFLFPGDSAPWSASENAKALRVIDSTGAMAILAGAAGTLIGTVQMLQALDDPSVIGPALSVALLTLLYPLLMTGLLLFPLSRHYRVAAIQAGSDPSVLEPDGTVRHVMQVLSLVGLSIGISFLLMLLCMASF